MSFGKEIADPMETMGSDLKYHGRMEDKFEIKEDKIKLINFVCACLIKEPKYYLSSSKDQEVIAQLVPVVAAGDAEFVLKLALYVRDDLNIRSTANYLLALACRHSACHPFVAKYFGAIVRLPTDMLEVCDLYLALPDRQTTGEALPNVLRKAVCAKLYEFDAYQLAKYNKEKAVKAKNKKTAADEKSGAAAAAATAKPRRGMGAMRGRGGRRLVGETPVNELLERPEEPSRKKLTLKQLIRKVHAEGPADLTMPILGRKYPADEAAFAKSGLSGVFDASRANKRMKLPTPETWETQLSALGNKHTTWESLLAHNKLPFMAMLRNLRNLILTGVSPEHHQLVMAKLTDERSVTTSRQLPWRFLSAFEAINVNLEELMNRILDIDEDGTGGRAVVTMRGRKGKLMDAQRKITKKALIPVHMPDEPLIARYRDALDTAIRIATVHNLVPIEGNTAVFIDVSGSMSCQVHSAGKMGKITTAMDIAILLGLMIRDVCVGECEMRLFAYPGPGSHGKSNVSVPVVNDTILKNVEFVRKYAERLSGQDEIFPFDYMLDQIKKKKRIDTIVVISDMMLTPLMEGRNADAHKNLTFGYTVPSILKKYRQEVNPGLLFVAMDLYGNGKSIVGINDGDSKDVVITGFSDNVLRFIAERGHGKQLEHVENIDKTKKLDTRKSGKARKSGPKPKQDKPAVKSADAEPMEVASETTAAI
eukprot:TRINITY_DN1478_c0_g1_i1.p2 TRINITY_DN1478_c0_g1~~TRINITY_DN1478_c0_g1_i1.p2  ORF type:complete len:706 (+),score=379.58 TRINITY_DN1478_c0_g1_i1:128-2245(+)